MANLEDRLRRDSALPADQRDAALESVRLAREGNPEAGGVVEKSLREGHKAGGIDKAAGGAVGVALVGLTLAQWYASYKAKQAATEPRVATSS